MKKELDFYSQTNLKSYNLDESMRYQLGMLDSLDAYTRLHSENVANITCRICEYMGLPTEFIVYCTICAYLHDIGKLFIPSNVLQKPGSLTDDEYEIIKSHTTLGYKMCMEDPRLKPYSAGTIYHHESLNGTGYPNGLVKKEIPLEGQIIRVADEFDAIVSKRQYKSHIGISDTLKLLVEETKPYLPKSDALTCIQEDVKLGKISPKVVKALFKVVIDDINNEIFCIAEYTSFLDYQIKRLESANKYVLKMQQAKKQKKKDYYYKCIELIFEKGENLDNYKNILEEYKSAFLKRKEITDNLFKEIKIIKKLKV
jgi:response regulator RpfG family c-di-GMP phosphodiesterase